MENDDIDKYERRMQDKKVKDESDQVFINFLSDELEPVLNSTEKSLIVPYYREFSTKDYKKS